MDFVRYNLNEVNLRFDDRYLLLGLDHWLDPVVVGLPVRVKLRAGALVADTVRSFLGIEFVGNHSDGKFFWIL